MESLTYVAVAVGSIEGKSRFTFAEGDWRNFTVTEDEILVSDKNSAK